MNKLNYKKKLLIVIIAVYLFNINIFLVFATNQYIYDVFNNSTTKKETDSSSISVINKLDNVDTSTFNTQSFSQILLEPVTNTVIYANNEHERLYPASVTKVMTLIIIMEYIDSGKLKYDDIITCSKNASSLGGSQIWFKEGETLSVDEALKSIAVVSANDVCVSMAEHIAGSEQNFVKMMNDKAKELELEDTNFSNCHGIDDTLTLEEHHTSAYDLAIMSRELYIKHPDIIKYTSIWMDSIRNGEFALTNTNKLVRFYNGTIGLKTGSTSKALFNVSVIAKRNNTSYISVIMKAPSSDVRNEEAKQLLDYGFANYEVQNIKSNKTVIENIKINKNISDNVDVILDEDISILTKKGEKLDLDEEIIYNDNLIAPINSGDIIGEYLLRKKDGSIVNKYFLKVGEDIKKSTLMDYYLILLDHYLLKI